jgi:regulatory protein YycI of two-component signal transduction system YycFG
MVGAVAAISINFCALLLPIIIVIFLIVEIYLKALLPSEKITRKNEHQKLVNENFPVPLTSAIHVNTNFYYDYEI